MKGYKRKWAKALNLAGETERAPYGKCIHVTTRIALLPNLLKAWPMNFRLHLPARTKGVASSLNNTLTYIRTLKRMKVNKLREKGKTFEI